MRIPIQITAMLCLITVSVLADEPTTAPSTEPTTAPSSQPTAINWDQAKDHVGQLVTVTGPVVGIHDFGGAAVLNVGKDFPDPTRFTVYISEDARPDMPADLDNGKIITVTGTVKLYHDVPEIEGDPAQITAVGAATTAPSTQP